MSEKLYTCPHCGKELNETIAFNGICPSCHKGFDVANLNPKLTHPIYEQPKKPQPPPAPLNIPSSEEVSNLKSVAKDYIHEADKYLQDPKHQGRVIQIIGGIFLLVIFLVIARSCINFLTITPQQAATTQAKENQALTALNQLDAEMLSAVKKQLSGSAEIDRILRSVSVNRHGTSSVYFDFEMNPDTLQESQDKFDYIVRNWCTTIAAGYKNGQWVTVRTRVNGVTVSEAEYSPLTGRVVVK